MKSVNPHPLLLRLSEVHYFALLHDKLSLDNFALKDLSLFIDRFISDRRSDLAEDVVSLLDLPSLQNLASTDLSDLALSLLAIHLKKFISEVDFVDWPELTSQRLQKLVECGFHATPDDNSAVHSRFADFFLLKFSHDSSFASVFSSVDISRLSFSQVKYFFQEFKPMAVGLDNVYTVLDFFSKLENQQKEFLTDIETKMEALLKLAEEVRQYAGECSETNLQFQFTLGATVVGISFRNLGITAK
jgi:hypothetical protein